MQMNDSSLPAKIQRPMSRSTITEIKNTLDGQQKVFNCQRLHQNAHELVIIYVMKQDILLEGIPIAKGTISLGYFWPDKHYNLYHWLDEDHNSIALYFNVSDQTAFDQNRVEWRDLVVDVLMTVDNPVRILDEDELPENIDSGLRQLIESTRDDLCHRHRQLIEYFSAYSKRLMQG